MMMYQSMLGLYWDLLLCYYMQSSETLQSLKNIYPMPDEWDTMRETDALLRLTQILSMNQHICFCCYLTFTCLFCTVKVSKGQFQLSKEYSVSDFESTSMAGCKSSSQRLIQGEHEANWLQGDNANAGSKVMEANSSNISLTSIGMTSLPCSVIPSWLTMVCT